MSKVKIVWFRDLKLWDLRSNLFINEVFANSKFELVQIKNLLYKIKIPILIQDEADYKRITISGNGGGAKIRDVVKGKTIKIKKQWLVKNGNFLVSKIGARDGAFGIADASLDNAIITSDFWAFDVDSTKINIYFLFMVVTTKGFIEFAKSISSGTALKRIDESKFLSAKIPLPPLEIQQEIVSQVESIKIQIKALQDEEKRLKDEIERYIYIALGLEKPKELIKHKVFTINFKDLTRWDVRHNQALATPLQKHLSPTQELNTQAQDLTQEALQEQAKNLTQEPQEQESSQEQALTPPPQGWDIKTLGEVCEKITDGTHKTPTYKLSGIPFLSIQNISKGYFDLSNVKYISHEEHIELTKRCEPKLNDILFCRIGTLGKAIKNTLDFEFSIFVSLALIRLKDKSTTDYVVNVLNSRYIADWIDKNKVDGVHTSKVNLNTLKTMPVPLPPLEIQEQIVNHVEKKQAKITSLQEKYKALQESLTNYLESCL